MHLFTSDLTACLICFSTLHIVGSLLFKLPSINHGINDQRPQLVLNHQQPRITPTKTITKTHQLHCGNQLFEANGRDSESTEPNLFLPRAETRRFERMVLWMVYRVARFSNVEEQPRFWKKKNTTTSVFGDVFELLCGHQ